MPADAAGRTTRAAELGRGDALGPRWRAGIGGDPRRALPRRIALVTLAGIALVAVALPDGAAAPTPTHPSVLTSSNPQSYGGFGGDMAVNGTLLAVASSETVSGHAYAGRVYVFDPTDGHLRYTLTSPSPQTNGGFGSVATNGRIIAVGAWGETAHGSTAAGHVYVFDGRTGTLLVSLTSPHPVPYGSFGAAVSVNGRILIAGAYGEKVAGQAGAGRAYVYDLGSWTLVATWTSPTPTYHGFFGWNVASDAQWVVVGAPNEPSSNFSYAGNAYVFSVASLRPVTSLASPNVQTGGNFGYTVAVAGGVLVVAAIFEDPGGVTDAGAVYLYSTSTFGLIATLTSPNGVPYGNFGRVATNGSVVVGAIAENASGIPDSGRAYTYTPAGVLLTTYQSPYAQYGGWFGTVAMDASPRGLFIGAPHETAGGYGLAGHLYGY